MRTLIVFVQGNPKAQPRPRACRRGKHAGVYDPGTADDWKEQVRVAVILAMQDHPDIDFPVTEPVACQMRFEIQRPKFHYSKRGLKRHAPTYHAGKPDLDNLAKAVMDAITDVGFWKGDEQVASLALTKQWQLTGPGVAIRIVW